MYASLGVIPRRPITVRATSANLSNRYRFAPASVTHAKGATHPDTGAVAAHIAPVCTTDPVMIRVQIANFAWSPMMHPRNVSPVRSIELPGVARASTSP